MIKRIKAASCSPLWVFAIPLLMVAGLLYGSITVWSAPRVEDGGVITMNRSDFDRLLGAEYDRGVKFGFDQPSMAGDDNPYDCQIRIDYSVTRNGIEYYPIGGFALTVPCDRMDGSISGGKEEVDPALSRFPELSATVSEGTLK